MKKIGRLCVVTDTVIQNKYSHYDIAQMAIKGGADMIQFRDKKMSTTEMIETAFKINKLCRKSNVTFIVNDRVDIAMIVDADGVHVGKEDIPAEEARKLLGKDKIIGLSNMSIMSKSYKNEFVDYLGFGHIFPTQSKIKIKQPLGLVKLKNMVNINKLPMLAIGGINVQNASSVMATGVHGIAVISGVIKEKDPADAVRKLKEIVYGKKN